MNDDNSDMDMGAIKVWAKCLTNDELIEKLNALKRGSWKTTVCVIEETINRLQGNGNPSR